MVGNDGEDDDVVIEVNEIGGEREDDGVAAGDNNGGELIDDKTSKRMKFN